MNVILNYRNRKEVNTNEHTSWRSYSLSNVKRRICHNCKKSNRGQLVPNPSSKNKEELIWICDNCYDGKIELRTVQNG